MAVQRKVNWLSQARVDLPDLRSIESAVENDFDGTFQSFMTNTTNGYVIRGFEISMAGAINGAASGLQMIVDPGAVLHPLASQSGTFYLVPTGTPAQVLNSTINQMVTGSFAPNSINFVGIDYVRAVDDATDAQVYLWDPTTDDESIEIAPRAIIMNFQIIISTASFPSNILPIATVTTDAGNNVVSITDARNNLFRLGTGGSSPNPFFVYPWTAQPEGRVENPSTSTSNAVNPFEGGDKMLFSQKDWMNAVMSILLEIKGTTYWYSESNSGSLASLREDLGNTILTGNSVVAHSLTVPGQINWSNTVYLKVIGSELAYAITANPTGNTLLLADDQAAYITLTRDAAINPNLVFINGSPTVTSVGSVPWTANLEAGDWIKLASDTHAGYVEIDTVNSLTTVTLVDNWTETSTGASGAISQYAFGVYTLPLSTGTARDIVITERATVPVGQDVVWLFARSDDGGSIARVYIKWLGAELEQGESREVSDTQVEQVLTYIGSPSETATAPQYVAALNPGSVPQVTQLTLGAASTMTTGQFFLIYSSANARTYQAWFNIDSGGGLVPDPSASATLEFDITSAMSASQVAATVATAFNSTVANDFTAVQGSGANNNLVTVTNNSAGTCNPATNDDVSAPFAILVTQSGTGNGNFIIQDGDSLTLAIKLLDNSLGLLDTPDYDESMVLVAPISSGSDITIPLNSRLGNIQQMYTVGKGVLELYLNGQRQLLGTDWDEVGSGGSASDQIQTLRNLIIGDTLEFRINVNGVLGSGGGGGIPGPQGPQGIPGVDASGGPISVSTKSGNYTVQAGDNFILVNAAAGAITISLPTASSVTGRIFYIKKIDATTNIVTIQAFGSQLIDGTNLITTNVQYSAFSLLSDGTQFWVF